jgi:hypothetical protein
MVSGEGGVIVGLMVAVAVGCSEAIGRGKTA